MKPLTTGERWLVNKAYHSVMVRKQVFDAFWDDRERSLRVRKVVGRRMLPVPAHCVHIGRYDPTLTWPQLIGDLEDTLKTRGNE